MPIKKTFLYTLFISALGLYFCAFTPECRAGMFPHADYTAQARFATRDAREAGEQTSYLDIFIPIYNSRDSILYGENDLMFFINPRITSVDFSTDEENFGAGLRYLDEDLFFEDGMILGANLYHDSFCSNNGLRHNQIGFGLEMLSTWLDARANYYHPVSGTRSVASDYVFAGDSLDLNETKEEPLKGSDAEIGVLLPVISDFVETRLYYGGYWFDSKITSDIRGTRIRLEINPSPLFTFNLESRDDKVSGSDLFIGGYFTMRFDLAEMFNDRDPLSGFKDTVYFRHGPRKLKERMTDPVLRDLNVVTVEHHTSKKIHDLIYVNNTNTGDSLEDGTLEHPHDTLAEAFTDARYQNGTWIFVYQGDGTGAGYTGTYTLADNTTLWGEGCRYLGLAGNGYPVIDGGGGSDIITLGKNSMVMGLHLQNGDHGINGENCESIEIRNNVFSDIGIPFGTAIVLDNNDGSTMNAAISGNTIDTNNANGISITSENFSTINVAISENTISENDGSGIFLTGGSTTLGDTSSISAVIENNTITGNGGNGITIQSNFATSLSVSVSHSTIRSNSLDGINLEDLGTSVINLDLGGGTLASPGYNSIYSNLLYHLDNHTDRTISAENNWWGSVNPSATKFSGEADYTPWLESNPN